MYSPVAFTCWSLHFMRLWNCQLSNFYYLLCGQNSTPWCQMVSWLKISSKKHSGFSCYRCARTSSTGLSDTLECVWSMARNRRLRGTHFIHRVTVTLSLFRVYASCFSPPFCFFSLTYLLLWDRSISKLVSYEHFLKTTDSVLFE